LQREIVNRKYVNDMLLNCTRRLAIAIVASVVAAAPAVYGNPPKDILLVPPLDLPELARQSGDAMLLYRTHSGRTLLYIEESRGTSLAVFDVTDPVRIKGRGTVKLDATEPFDFVSALGKQEELIRFRQSRADAVLDLRKEKIPTIRAVPEPKSPGSITNPTDDEFTFTGQESQAQSAQTCEAGDISRVFDVSQVRENVTNCATGTTFLLADNGLFVIRRPTAERDQRERETTWFWQHTGG
jgi:hypothetical protein